MAGPLRRLTDRLARTAGERDAAELQHHARTTGATVIDELADRQLATVSGIVRAVTLRPRSNAPALVVELYDGTQSLVLVWLGRRRIRGIEPGTYLRATGRICHRDGVTTVFNPAYELLPPPAGGQS